MYLNDTDYTVNDAYAIGRYLIYETYGQARACVNCGSEENLVVSRIDGDPRNVSKDNLRVLCKRCSTNLARGLSCAPIDEYDVVARYQDGGSLLDIAAELQIPYSRVRATLIKNGITIRNRNIERKEIGVESVKSLLADGASVDRMARVLGVSKTTIRAYMKEINNGV